MSDLTPITREEQFLDGNTDLTPITRQEMFIKHIYDASQEIPEPITREEWFLKKAAGGGGGGDITVVPLSVTDNGTYTAPTGKAYSPVSVSVPLPQNAHLATAITSQPVTDASDYPLPKCDVTVTDADKCEVIVTDDGVIVEDSEPYNYRQSAGGDTELDELVGGTVAWNQLVDINTTEVISTSGHKILTYIGGTWAISVSDGTAISVTGGTDMFFDLTLMFGSTIADYIYSLEQSTAGAGVSWLKEHFLKLFADGYKAYNAGELASVKATAHETVGFNQWDEEWEDGSIDGTTGQNTSASGVIRSKNHIPVLSNTTYCFTCLSAKVTSYCFLYGYDKNKNFIGRLTLTQIGTSNNATFITDSSIRYVRFRWGAQYGTTYNNDICINISDPSKNGTYEPYVKHSYPISPVELRGLYKLDANNKLYCDGDSYRCDGRVKRRYGIVDLGSLNWSSSTPETTHMFTALISNRKIGAQDCITTAYIMTTAQTADMPDKSIKLYGTSAGVIVKDSAFSDVPTFKTAMSGVYLIYELATATEEYTSPFEKNQAVDAGGTEEYIDDRSVSVPVGHSTKYYHGKAYTKYFPTKTGVVEMVDEGIMPMTPMYISANGEIDAEYWK